MSQIKKSLIFDLILIILINIILIFLFVFIKMGIVEQVYSYFREYELVQLTDLLPIVLMFTISIIYLIWRRRRGSHAKSWIVEGLTSLDSLTQVLSRRTLERSLASEWERFSRYRENFCIVIFDIDDFSDINDNLGHLAGDRILIEIADMLKNNTRKTDVIGRWGEEEFLILCPVCKRDQATILAEKLRSNLYRMLKDGVELSASFAVAQSSQTGSLEELVKRAHLGLRKAKGRGKNCVVSI